MNTAAIVALVLSIIAGLTAAYGTFRERKTADASLLVTGMQGHMTLLGAENGDLRERLRRAEDRIYEQNTQLAAQERKITEQDKHISELRQEVTRCEADKDRLRIIVEDLRRRVGGLEGRA